MSGLSYGGFRLGLENIEKADQTNKVGSNVTRVARLALSRQDLASRQVPRDSIQVLKRRATSCVWTGRSIPVTLPRSTSRDLVHDSAIYPKFAEEFHAGNGRCRLDARAVLASRGPYTSRRAFGNGCSGRGLIFRSRPRWRPRSWPSRWR